QVPALTDLSIARQLAEYTRSVAEGASSTIRGLGQTFANLQEAFSNGTSASGTEIRGVANNIGVLMIGLFGSFFLLRLITTAVGHRVAARVAGKGILQRLAALLGALVVDAGSILLAWGLGYVIALNSGVLPNGQMGINQSLLLNAFLIVEM